MSSIDNRGENEFADEESNLVGMSEEYGEEKEDHTVSKKTEQKQNPKMNAILVRHKTVFFNIMF